MKSIQFPSVAFFLILFSTFAYSMRAIAQSKVSASLGAGAQAEPGSDAEQEGSTQRIHELEASLRDAQEVIAQQRKVLLESELASRRAHSIIDMFVLQPARFPSGDWRPAETRFEDCWFVTSDGVRLHGWYARHRAPQAIVLYLHGNAGNLTHRAPLVDLLHDRLRASVLVFDYRGYGRSEGAPMVDGLVLDARAARQYLAKRESVAADEMILIGRSLGGAVAVELAANDGARALVLESTFASLREVAAAHYPKWAADLVVPDRLDSAACIGKYEGPLLMSHGDADRTIPYAQGRRLFSLANEPKKFFRIRGGDHNDPQPPAYFQELERFVTGAVDR